MPRRDVARIVPNRQPVRNDRTGAAVQPRVNRPNRLHALKEMKSAKQRFKAHKARLLAMSENLPAPPATYDAGTQYRVKLNSAIQMPSGMWLRPQFDCVVSGAFATTIAAKIVGAQALSNTPPVPQI